EVFRDVGSRRRSAADRDFIEIRRCRLRPDAAILLCSDGLTDRLTAAQVREIVDGYDGDAARVACDLVDAANRAGGHDNVTALFVAGPEFSGRSAVTRPHSSATRLRPRWSVSRRLLFLASGVVIGMLIWMAVRR